MDAKKLACEDAKGHAGARKLACHAAPMHSCVSGNSAVASAGKENVCNDEAAALALKRAETDRQTDDGGHTNVLREVAAHAAVSVIAGHSQLLAAGVGSVSGV
jgi:hypothetical protein